MDFGIPQSNGIEINVSNGFFVQIIWLAAIIFAVMAVIFITLLILRKIFKSGMVSPGIFQKKIFILTIPKIYEGKEIKETDIHELIAKIENFYATLGGLWAYKGFKTWLFGRYDSWSFEIVVGSDGLITFYIAVPQYLCDHIQQQFLSSYPHCLIEEVADYNIFGAVGYVAGGYLKLVKEKMFPILTYKNMEVDPLTATLSTLSKLPPGHTVAIQFVMRSARAKWRQRGVKVASQMHQGKSLKQAIKSDSAGLIGVLGKPADWFSVPQKNEPDKAKETYHLTSMEEQTAKAIEEKAAKAGLDVNIRLITFGPTEAAAKDIVHQIAQSFAQYSNYEYANGFKAIIKGTGKKLINDFIYRNFDEKLGLVLNTEEMASLWHLPLIPTEVPNIRWLQARKLTPPINTPTAGLILGENLYRGKQTLIRIKNGDRQRHMYIIGMTGTGKSVFQANLAIQDILNGKGVCVVDPHGSLIDDYIMPYIPKERTEDVVYFDPSDVARPIGLNMLEAGSQHEMDFAVGEMITIFYKLLPD
ncbi:DUF87 domain-containing protein, partial [Candidatus Falkowbacteria bacterium]|nr:DUF87 domain-containing protein [Candidatus Falkowbacteria bacterium]